MKPVKIGIVGSGYVGLVTAACFAELGHNVLAIDKDDSKIEQLNSGAVPIYEVGLAELIAKNMAAGRLHFSSQLDDLSDGFEAIFIAVSTPSGDDGSADLTAIFEVANALAKADIDNAVVVTKSTVPVGTGQKIEALISEQAPDKSLTVVSNPEFLREGTAIEDFMQADRVVVGLPSGSDEQYAKAHQIMADIYAPLAAKGINIFYTRRVSAEVIKYAANAFLATKVSYINQIADFCEAVGADIMDVSKAVGLDPRIGSRFFRAGPGYGGSCFPKDTKAILHTAHALDVDLSIVKAASESNDTRKRAMVDRIAGALNGQVEGKKIALLGLAFKPGTDDMRDAPSLDVIAQLLARNAKVSAFDPESMAQCAAIFPTVDYSNDVESCVKDADAVVVLTEWPQFGTLDLPTLSSQMKGNALIDLRNIFDPATAGEAGLAYSSIGRQS